MANRHRRPGGSVSNSRYCGTENCLQYRRGGKRPTAAPSRVSQKELHRQRQARSRVRPGLLQLHVDEVAPLARRDQLVDFVSTFVNGSSMVTVGRIPTIRPTMTARLSIRLSRVDYIAKNVQLPPAKCVSDRINSGGRIPGSYTQEPGGSGSEGLSVTVVN